MLSSGRSPILTKHKQKVIKKTTMKIHITVEELGNLTDTGKKNANTFLVSHTYGWIHDDTANVLGKTDFSFDGTDLSASVDDLPLWSIDMMIDYLGPDWAANIDIKDTANLCDNLWKKTKSQLER